jgi:hypothetical protein
VLTQDPVPQQQPQTAGNGATDAVASPTAGAKAAGAATMATSYGMVMAIRFLERGALAAMGRLVDANGGFLLHCTFQLEADGTWPHASPKRADKVRAHST